MEFRCPHCDGEIKDTTVAFCPHCRAKLSQEDISKNAIIDSSQPAQNKSNKAKAIGCLASVIAFMGFLFINALSNIKINKYTFTALLYFSPFFILAAVALIVMIRKANKEKEAEERAQEELRAARVQNELLQQQKERIEKQKRDEEIALRIRSEEAIRAASSKKFQEKLAQIPQAEIVLSQHEFEDMDISDISNLPMSKVTANSILMNLSTFVVVDVETTGLSAVSDKITEVSAIRFIDFEPVECFTTLINPQKTIPDNVVKMTGITNEIVSDKPTFDQVIISLDEFIGKYNIVGYNLGFDLKFLYVGGYDFLREKRKYYDCLQLAKKAVGDNTYNHKLTTVAEYYGIIRDNAHRSLSDSYTTGLVFEKIVKNKLCQ